MSERASERVSEEWSWLVVVVVVVPAKVGWGIHGPIFFTRSTYETDLVKA